MGNWNDEKGLSPLAVGYGWAMRILSLAIEVGLVILAGYWLDTRVETHPLFLILATFLGMTMFFVQLMIMAGNQKESDQTNESDRS
ncbi:MAG: hypothetical protein Q4G68_00835 [Planctomycetia bacterium]|nr:hypothetical protein [Planctomycetia bacterium]